MEPSTPAASKAAAQTRIGESLSPNTGPVCDGGPADEGAAAASGEGRLFELPDSVIRPAASRVYEHQPGDPLYRPLRIFALDPAVSRLEGAVAVVNVPYEPLEPGPIGDVLEVDNLDDSQGVHYRRADLDAYDVLIRNGRDPSLSDPSFHQQMVYAVARTVYKAFRRALGRQLTWGFEVKENDRCEHRRRLRLRPHAFRGRNAYYDKQKGEVCFGYYDADGTVAGRNLPGGIIFSCLSHDVIAHEVTHAILDGLRAHFTLPIGPDVLAFHEAFADLVAIFQHFSYREVVQSAIRKSHGNLRKATLLTDVARQFGQTTGCAESLRSAVDEVDQNGHVRRYPGSNARNDAEHDPHELGKILVAAVFEAFTTVFARRTERYFRLASGGTGVLPPGELPGDLQHVLAEEASKVASQFLSICIRAIDYCPPVDLEIGEFLRAVITADYDLVPDDPLAYREAFINAFSRRGIYPPQVRSLSEDALLWRKPEPAVPDIEGLSFAKLQFRGDPACAAGSDELRRQARALGQAITRPDCLAQFGLIPLSTQGAQRPQIHSIRSSRRIGPDGQVVFDLVAEVTQRRRARFVGRNGPQTLDFYGGATVILGPNGEIRYVIAKNVANEDRLRRQFHFAATAGARFWAMSPDRRATPTRQLFQLLHAERNSPSTYLQ